MKFLFSVHANPGPPCAAPRRQSRPRAELHHWPWATYGPDTDTVGTGNLYAGYPAGVAAAVFTFANSFWDIFNIFANAALVPLVVRPFDVIRAFRSLKMSTLKCLGSALQALQATYLIWLLVRGRSPVEQCVAEIALPPTVLSSRTLKALTL